MTNHEDLPELVRDFKLPTVFQHDLTIHTKPPGRRTAPRQAIWRQERILGHGGYGIVSLQRECSKGSSAPELRAVKQIQIPNLAAGVGSFVHELEALAKFSQDRYADFFVKSQGWYLDSGSLYIAMEYCECGDLRAYLANKKTLPEDQAQDIAAQVLGGLSLMHEVGFAHRDIKPANILIKSQPPNDWWVKVCDLGLSKRTGGVAASMTVRGTPGFMPPETIGLDGNPRTANPLMVDMWCFGETVYQMLTGSPAFGSYADLVDYHKGNKDFPGEAMKKANATESAVGFIRSLMMPKPSERLTASQALEQPWMRLVVEEFTALPDLGQLSIGNKQQASPQYIPSLDELTQPSGAWTATTQGPGPSRSPGLSKPVHLEESTNTSSYIPKNTKPDSPQPFNPMQQPELSTQAYPAPYLFQSGPQPPPLQMRQTGTPNPLHTPPVNALPTRPLPQTSAQTESIPHSSQSQPSPLHAQPLKSEHAPSYCYDIRTQPSPPHMPREHRFTPEHAPSYRYDIRTQPSPPYMPHEHPTTAEKSPHWFGTTGRPSSSNILQQNMHDDAAVVDGTSKTSTMTHTTPAEMTDREIHLENLRWMASMENDRRSRAVGSENDGQREIEYQRGLVRDAYQRVVDNPGNSWEELDTEDNYQQQQQRIENELRRRRSPGMGLTFDGPLPKDISIEVEVGLDGSERGRTRIPSRLISKRALFELQLPFTEETGTIVVQEALGSRQIDHLLKWSESIKKSDAAEALDQYSRETLRQILGRTEANIASLGKYRGRFPSTEQRPIGTELPAANKGRRRGRIPPPSKPEAWSTVRTSPTDLVKYSSCRAHLAEPRRPGTYINGVEVMDQNSTRPRRNAGNGVEQAESDNGRMDQEAYDDPRLMTVRQREEVIRGSRQK